MRFLSIVKDWQNPLWYLRSEAVRVIAPRRAVHSRGLKFTLQCNNWITHYRWKSYNTKEPETLDWLDSWIGDGDTFFDVGANIGVYSIYAALRHPRARVIAFEPEYANLHLLRDNVVANGLQERIDVYATALSDRPGISYLHVQDLTPGSALHTESRAPLRKTLAQHPVVWREGICAITLDAFCDETALQPDCLKIDVDGTERRVLEGGGRTLRSSRLRSLIIELPEDKSARALCEQLLLDAGLHREWHGSHSPNEVWVRTSVSNGGAD